MENALTPTKRKNPLVGSIADVIQGVSDFASKPFGYDNPPARLLMEAMGVPGAAIKYLDQGSRGAGDGTRNYVVFDDNLPKIVERNGKSLAEKLTEALK